MCCCSLFISSACSFCTFHWLGLSSEPQSGWFHLYFRGELFTFSQVNVYVQSLREIRSNIMLLCNVVSVTRCAASSLLNLHYLTCGNSLKTFHSVHKETDADLQKKSWTNCRRRRLWFTWDHKTVRTMWCLRGVRWSESVSLSHINKSWITKLGDDEESDTVVKDEVKSGTVCDEEEDDWRWEKWWENDE